MAAQGQDGVITLRADAVAWQEIDGETILLDLKNSCYLGVNASGTLIWRTLAAGTTRDELIKQLQREFGIDEARASADVDAFLADCAARDLLQ